MEAMETKQLIHFSHRHPLEHLEVDEEDQVLCSGCEVGILGSAYRCTKPSCDFILHDSCTDLPRQVKHKSHPKHPLLLDFFPPYSDGEFTCNACGNSGHAFTYHCASCKYDLHVECASLPETEVREDHQHPLVLVYSFQSNKAVEGKAEGKAVVENFVCYVCDGPIEMDSWAYCCSDCNNYDAHLECVSN